MKKPRARRACDKLRHYKQAKDWYYHLVKDANTWEQLRFGDTIHDYKDIISHCQEIYDSTPPTTIENLLIRATSLSTMRKAKRDLARTLTEYDSYKQFKTRTAISK